ncbi:SET domain-containing protein [Candidatus Babeliales bacterium]|nr:SET domain-containing protein [Candidatus Babeliales bacterium]MBP9843887.1 SET domain-containing protein [Candidatus Babeliales bacterium]
MTQTTEFSFLLKTLPNGTISIFATHDISEGTSIFNEPFALRVMKTKDVPDAFKDYYLPLNNEECVCPEKFDRMEIGWYLNHSSNPNIEKRVERNYENIIDFLQANSFYAIKNIKAGDEITMDLERVHKIIDSILNN